MEYGYNSLNQRTKEKRRLGDGLYQIFLWSYDAAGRMVEQSSSIDRADGSRGFAATAYSYDKKPLSQATIKLAGISQSIRDNAYRLDETHILTKLTDGSCVIISTAADTKLRGRVPLSEMPRDSILFLSA